MSRETGYFWCKLKRVNSIWEIGFYNAAGWNLTGLSSSYHDKDFEEIDERRITREPEPKKGNHLLGTEILPIDVKVNRFVIKQAEKSCLGDKLFGLI